MTAPPGSEGSTARGVGDQGGTEAPWNVAGSPDRFYCEATTIIDYPDSHDQRSKRRIVPLNSVIPLFRYTIIVGDPSRYTEIPKSPTIILVCMNSPR